MKFKKIYIEITNICNKNCSFCSKTNRKKREMSIDEFETVLKRINNYTDYIYLHIKGEPLTHSNFEEIVKLCKKYNKKSLTSLPIGGGASTISYSLFSNSVKAAVLKRPALSLSRCR